jgi:hypothetical protein
MAGVIRSDQVAAVVNASRRRWTCTEEEDASPDELAAEPGDQRSALT